MDIIAQDKIMSAISTVATSARNVEATIHAIAYSTLDHVRQYGDSSGVVALLNALPKGQRVQGLAAWYRHMSSTKMALRQDKSKVWVCSLKDRTDADFLMDQAETVTYSDLTEEPSEAKVMDVAAFLKSLERVSTNDKLIEKGERAGQPKVTLAARALAAKFVSMVRAAEAGQTAAA